MFYSECSCAIQFNWVSPPRGWMRQRGCECVREEGVEVYPLHLLKPLYRKEYPLSHLLYRLLSLFQSLLLCFLFKASTFYSFELQLSQCTRSALMLATVVSLSAPQRSADLFISCPNLCPLFGCWM